MVTFDGLFGLLRKRAAGVQIHEPLLKICFYFRTKKNVDKFASYTTDTKKEEGVKKHLIKCKLVQAFK